MNKLAVVGVGGIGRRHLQSLLKSALPTDKLYAVDPSNASKQALEEQLSDSDRQKLVFLNHACDLPDEINFLVIACNSKNRLKVLSEIIATKRVKNIILEKVLFPSIDEYWKAIHFINQVENLNFVNHPRRLYPINLVLKDLLQDKEFELRIEGGEWGLLCNALHFIDLCQFFASDASLSITKFDIEKLFESKRQGYSEAFGVITGQTGKGHFSLYSIEGYDKPLLITIESKDFRVYLEEATNSITIETNNKTVKELLKDKPIVTYQSDLTGIIYLDIFNNRQVHLPSYQLSATSHIVFLASLENALNKLNISFDSVNIT